MEKKGKPMGGYVGETAPVFWALEKIVWLGWITVRTFLSLTIEVLRRTYVAFKKRKTHPQKEGGLSPRESAAQTALNAVGAIVLDTRYEPATRCELFIDGKDGWGLFMALHPGRIDRCLKTERERFHWQRSRVAYDRIKLQPFSLEDAQKHKLQFNFEGCIAFTRTQFASALGDGKAKIPKAELLDFGDDGGANQGITEDAHENETPSPQQVVAGRVITAGVVRITKPNGRAYDTFQVTLRNGGREETLTGVDLREKFEARQFSIGDMVTVAKTTEKFKVGDSRRKKNSFTITVNEKANS